MTPVVAELHDLAGDELIAALERRFDTSLEELSIGGRTISILRPRNSDDLIREEDFVKDERLPYWADIWPSSIILASFLVSRAKRRALTSTRCLELGCGVGLVTTAAILAGYEVTATDYYTDALAFTRANSWRNTGVEPLTRMIDWRSFPSDADSFDLILASDVLYEKEYAQLLPGIFKGSLAPGGMVLLADPGRIGVPQFTDACAESDLLIREKTTFPFEVGEIRQSIDIYQIADSRS